MGRIQLFAKEVNKYTVCLVYQNIASLWRGQIWVKFLRPLLFFEVRSNKALYIFTK